MENETKEWMNIWMNAWHYKFAISKHYESINCEHLTLGPFWS